jgi:hypothetical protein
MRLLGNVLIVLATIVLVLFFWVVTDPVIQPPNPLVMLGMPTMILSLYVVGFLARFIRLPKD